MRTSRSVVQSDIFVWLLERAQYKEHRELLDMSMPSNQ